MTTDATPLLPGFETRELRHRGTPLRYAVGGAGPPVVLVHGLGGAASNWRALAPALATERRVIVPELPGHGGSAPLAAAPTVDPFADAVLAVLEAEDALPAPWVGHSLGGLVGLRAAVRRPEAVAGVVLAAAPGISSSSRVSEAVVSVIGLAQPGRIVARRRRAWSASPLGRTVAFGWWGLADPVGIDPELAEAFLAGPAEHTDTFSAGQALIATDPRPDLDRVQLSVPLPLGRPGQLGAARGRHGVRAPAAGAAAGDRRLRSPAHRRTAGSMSEGDSLLSLESSVGH